MMFAAGTLLFGVVLLVCAWVCAQGVVRWPRLSSVVPRERIAGEILGVLCLGWAAYHVCGMMEGGLARYRVLVVLLVPVVSILAYTHLDFLFARSFGGFLLLMVNYLLHGAFATRVPLRPLYGVCCYAIGLVGLWLVGAPWTMRDALDRAGRSRRWRLGLVSALACGGVLFGVYALLPRGG